jgi:MATE family multidrug resistance protein
MLRGLSDTRVPMIIAVVSYWIVGLPLGYLLGIHFEFGARGVWWGLAAGLIVSAAAMNWRFAMRDRLGLVGS